jgi:hypothetical protein
VICVLVAVLPTAAFSRSSLSASADRVEAAAGKLCTSKVGADRRAGAMTFPLTITASNSLTTNDPAAARAREYASARAGGRVAMIQTSGDFPRSESIWHRLKIVKRRACERSELKGDTTGL